MRPTPQEIISGISRILKDTIEPQLADEHALNRLREIRSVLAQVDWNDAAIKLGRDTDAVDALLQDWSAWSDADETRSAAFAAQRTQIAELLASSYESLRHEPFAELEARHAQYERVVVDVSSATSQWSRDGNHGDAAAPILQRLREHYSSQRG
ncbi:hypothetical protein [Rhodococcus opacus]|uniref:Uncharacterized protein n=1 Tax=Rhodococcus opacus (strain B4) TaxID=632772 RepID=C1B3P2_RHOOB|nr:hypothetical protein [Rhodococcus opacus]BAH50740.1 hypothetical protein ROP_24930 [Rhodococcus opacus B4]